MRTKLLKKILSLFPSHTTERTVPYSAVPKINNKSTPNNKSIQRHETKTGKEGPGEGKVQMPGPRVPPGPPTIVSTLHGVVVIQTQCNEALKSRTGFLPLPPDDQAQSPADPEVQFLGHSFNFT